MSCQDLIGETERLIERKNRRSGWPRWPSPKLSLHFSEWHYASHYIAIAKYQLRWANWTSFPLTRSKTNGKAIERAITHQLSLLKHTGKHFHSKYPFAKVIPLLAIPVQLCKTLGFVRYKFGRIITRKFPNNYKINSANGKGNSYYAAWTWKSQTTTFFFLPK